MLVLEIFFLLIIKHLEIKDKYLNTASFILHMQTIRRFFLKDAQSIETLVEIFNTFSLLSGLKPNLTICERAGIVALKGVQVKYVV